MDKMLAHDHVVTIQYALSLAAMRLRKRAKTSSCSMTAEWRENEAQNILEALEAFKQVHGDEAKTEQSTSPQHTSYARISGLWQRED